MIREHGFIILWISIACSVLGIYHFLCEVNITFDSMVRVLKCVVDMLRFDCARNSQGMSGRRCFNSMIVLFGMVKCVIHMLSFAHARNNRSMRCRHALVDSVSVEGVIHWFT